MNKHAKTAKHSPSPITLLVALAFSFVLLSNEAAAAIRILSAAPKSIQLQPHKALTLSIKGSGLSGIRSGALSRDPSGRQRIGKLRIRYSGGLTKGRLIMTLMGKVPPGSYFVHLTDSLGSSARVPVRINIGAVRRSPGRPANSGKTSKRPAVTKRTTTGRPAARNQRPASKQVTHRAAAGRPSPATAGRPDIKVTSIQPRAPRLYIGRPVTLTLTGQGLTAIKQGALYTDKKGTTQVGKLQVRYSGSASKGRLILIPTGQIPAGSFYIQLSDNRRHTLVLPIRAHIQNTSTPRTGKKSPRQKQIAGSPKARTPARKKPIPHTITTAAHQKPPSKSPAQLARRRAKAATGARHQDGRNHNRRDAELRNRERIEEMGMAATGNHPKRTKPTIPTEVGAIASRRDPDQDDSMQNAIDSISSIKGVRGSRGYSDEGKQSSHGNTGLGDLPSNNPFAQTESNAASTGTTPEQDRENDMKELAEGSITGKGDLGNLANQADANQRQNSMASIANMEKGLGKKVAGKALDATKKLSDSNTGAEHLSAGTRLAIDVISDVKEVGENVKTLVEGAVSPSAVAKAKAVKAAYDLGTTAGKGFLELGAKDLHKVFDASSKAEREMNKKAEAAFNARKARERNNNNNSSNSKPKYVSSDQRGTSDPTSDAWIDRQTRRDAKRIQPNRTTRAGNQINVGREGVERVDLSEARPVDRKAMFGNPGGADSTAGRAGAGTAQQPRPKGDVDYQDAPYQSSGPRNDDDLMNIGTSAPNGTVTAPGSSSSSRSPSSGSGYTAVAARQTGVQIAASQYSTRVAPNNACTALVRKVCGTQNQCASSPGCPPAKQLLERYNQSEDSADTEASCAASLENGTIFPACGE